MIDLLTEFANSLTWRGALIGLLIFLVTFAVNLAIVSFILVRIPSDYFKNSHKTEFWSGPNPAFRALGIIGKNILGILLLALGIVLSVPGVPGQGLLTILLGIMLLDFPGKRDLEYRIVSQPRVRNAIDKLRHKFGKDNLVLD